MFLGAIAPYGYMKNKQDKHILEIKKKLKL